MTNPLGPGGTSHATAESVKGFNAADGSPPFTTHETKPPRGGVKPQPSTDAIDAPSDATFDAISVPSTRPSVV